MSKQADLVRNQPQPVAHADQRASVAPPCDIYENSDEIILIVDLPGVTKDNLKVNLDKGVLTLDAHRDVALAHGTALGVELYDCDYRRQFAVPGGIDPNKISAELKYGVLHLRLAKSEALKPRQITVQAG